MFSSWCVCIILMCLLVQSSVQNLNTAIGLSPPSTSRVLPGKNVEGEHQLGVRFSNSSNYGSERPYFDDISPRNVTAVVGQPAVLKCRVKHKGDRTVSWMRKRDLHILTSNIFTYTGDARFTVIHPPDGDDWDLRVEYAQNRDAGIYECQVNTEPKINLAVYLHVQEEPLNEDASDAEQSTNSEAARAQITGSQDLYVKRGSTISLSCSVNVHASTVQWYHGSSVVDFDSPRGGISLETEKTDAGTTSRLLLTRAQLRDSGNYTCVPSGAVPASVNVHVLNGEHPAAMQTSNGGLGISHYDHKWWSRLLVGSWLLYRLR